MNEPIVGTSFCVYKLRTLPYVIIAPPPINSINAVILTILEAESSRGICTTYCTGLIGRGPINPVQYV